MTRSLRLDSALPFLFRDRDGSPGRYPEEMRLCSFLLAVCAFSQSFRLEPKIAKQGDVLRITADGTATSARMLERSIRLFPQTGGGRLGLMPVPANAKPGVFRLELLDASGAVLDAKDVTIKDAHFPSQNVILDRRLRELRPAPGEAETVAAFRSTVSEVRRWQEPFAQPVPGCMTSPFGVKRLHNGKPTDNYHAGIDQRTPAGEPVRVIADGTVRLVREYILHGNVVGVDHGQGLVSMYLHLSKFAVAEGAVLKKGDVAGYAGSTGRSTAPHLHWSVYANGVAVNPAQWIALRPCGTSKPAAKHRRK